MLRATGFSFASPERTRRLLRSNSPLHTYSMPRFIPVNSLLTASSPENTAGIKSYPQNSQPLRTALLFKRLLASSLFLKR